MADQNNKSVIPDPPKSIGLSWRLFVAIISFFVIVALLFFLFITHSSTRSLSQKASHTVQPINQEAAGAQIAKIAHESNKQPWVSLKPSQRHPNKMSTQSITQPQQTKSDNTAFQEGSESSISVYHRQQSNNGSTHSESSSQSNTTIDPANQLSSMQANNRNAYQAQNMQSEKLQFLKNAKDSTDDYIHSTVHKPLSPYELKAGTIIPATLVTRINSSLPGTIIAKVRRDVFDTVTGSHCLIPQGTTLIGAYDSQIAYGQSRVLIVWSRMIFPNGNSFDLQSMPGVDLTGMAGLHDKVDHHYFQVFGNALLMSVFGSLGQLSQPKNTSNQLTNRQVLYAALGQQMSQTTMQLIEKNMNIQPTIMIRHSMDFNVLLIKDIFFQINIYHGIVK